MKTTLEMAREAGFEAYRYRGLLDHVPEDVFAATVNITEEIQRFAELVRADEREQFAALMMQRGYATGHGDTVEDLLKELEWQIRESEREAIEALVESLFDDPDDAVLKFIVDSIRERGQA